MKLFGKFVVGVSTLAIAAGGGAFADDVVEEMRDVASFSKIKNKGSFEVFVTVGGAQSVKVTADSDVIEKIETEVRGGTLNIAMDADRSWWRNNRVGRMRLDITVPSLEAALVHGSGDFEINGVTDGDFEASVHGSGDISLNNATVRELNIDVKGSGDIVVSGTCEDIDVEVKGSGSLEARDMECVAGDVGIMGSGDVDIYLKEKVDVSIMGSGDVTVWGKPEQVKTRSMGSGEVTLR